MRTGNYGGEVGRILAGYLKLVPEEKIIVHHYTDKGNEVQVEVEVEWRLGEEIKFSRYMIKAGE